MTLQTAAANADYGTTASGSSFYAAMRILPRRQREAMFQIYSFCRQVDDIADSDGPRPERLAALQQWRDDIDALYQGNPPPRLQDYAASVRNFWWHGIALMEGAATRAVHDDPRRACRAFLDVLDHWERVGDWSQQWIALRYVVRLLVRLDAAEDAVALHAALDAAGKPSPLHVARLADLARDLGDERYANAVATGSKLAGSAVVAHARAGLARHV